MSDWCNILVGKKKRFLYEKVAEQDGDDYNNYDEDFPRRESRRRRSVLVLTLVLISLGILLWRPLQGWCDEQSIDHPVHHEKIPTFLSIRHADDGSLVYALENPLYDQVQHAPLSRYHHLENSNRKELVPAPSEEISVTVSTTQLRRGQDLTLQWSVTDEKKAFFGNWFRGGNDLDNHVWVLFCGEASAGDTDLWQYSNVYDAATVKQVRATCDASATSSSSPSCWHIPDFPTSHRQETCQFVLYNAQWHVRASSPRIGTLDAVTSPTNLHLALTQDPTEMSIQFASGQGTPIVAYASASSHSDRWIDGHVPGTTVTYEASDLCMAPANETGPGKFQSPGLLHTVVLKGLQPNTSYRYKAGVKHGQGVTWSEPATFTTAPLQNDTSIYPFSYLVYADQGCPLNGWFQGAAFTAAVVAREVPSIRMVHHFGDLSYAEGAAHQWDAWMTMVEPIARRVPYHIGIGNHEYDYTANGNGRDPTGGDVGYHPVWGNFDDDSGGECGVPVSRRFRMPASPGDVFWYAHDFANLHTVVLSSEHDLSPGSVQYEWLARDLAGVDRAKTPWLVVEMHRPLYESETKWDQNDVGIALRMEIEHMLRDFQVDLVLAGHYHAYLRTCDGLYKSRCDRDGPMHVTIGTAGAHLDEEDLFDNPWTENYIKHKYGYGRITIHNATDLDLEFIQGAAVEDDPEAGKVLDTVRIHRERP